MLRSKVVFIAGGAGLLGRPLSCEMIKQGATVIIGDLAAAKGPAEQSRLAELMGTDNFTLLTTDINGKNSVNAAISSAVKLHGKIDSFVNCTYPKNANYGKDFFAVEYADFCENLNLHLGGYFLATQQFGRFFSENGGGSILNFASIYGVMTPRFEIYEGTTMTMPVEYAAIKAGIIHMTAYTAKFLREKNVRANSISPGGILDKQPDVFLQKYKQHCATKGMLDPGDIASTAAFLLSDAAKYITGQNFVVDDGFSL